MEVRNADKGYVDERRTRCESCKETQMRRRYIDPEGYIYTYVYIYIPINTLQTSAAESLLRIWSLAGLCTNVPQWIGRELC